MFGGVGDQAVMPPDRCLIVGGDVAPPFPVGVHPLRNEDPAGEDGAVGEDGAADAFDGFGEVGGGVRVGHESRVGGGPTVAPGAGNWSAVRVDSPLPVCILVDMRTAGPQTDRRQDMNQRKLTSQGNSTRAKVMKVYAALIASGEHYADAAIMTANIVGRELQELGADAETVLTGRQLSLQWIAEDLAAFMQQQAVTA